MTLITRTAKGSKLTTSEMDGNLTYLESEAQKYWEADGETGIKPKDGKHIDASIIDNLNCVYVTYSDLVDLIDNQALQTGKNYFLMDFAQSYNIFDAGIMAIQEEKIGALEPLILKAISSSKFDKVAISPLRPNDIIHYSFDILDIRDIAYGNGVDTVNANFKGMIYYRKDTVQNNECHYNFVPTYGVKFRRWAVDAVAFDDGTAYVAKDVCKSGVDGKIYKCITATTGQGDPTVNTPDWILWLDITADSFVSPTSVAATLAYLGDITPTNLIVNNTTENVDYKDYETFGEYYNRVHDVHFDKVNFEYIIPYLGFSSSLNNNVIKTIDSSDTCFNVFLNANNNGNTIVGKIYNITAFADFIGNFSYGLFRSNSLGESFINNILNADYFLNNSINTFYGNIISGSFSDNNINRKFSNNNIKGAYFNIFNAEFEGNTIGST